MARKRTTLVFNRRSTTPVLPPPVIALPQTRSVVTKAKPAAPAVIVPTQTGLSVTIKPVHNFKSIPTRAAVNRVLSLGLDLGTTTGYSIALPTYDEFGPSSIISIGQLDLSAGDYDSGAIRFVRLRQFLCHVMPDVIFYEEPKATYGQGPISMILGRVMPAAELFAAFKSHVCSWAEEANVPCEGLPIGTIKKFATGVGNASKEQMIQACNDACGSKLTVDDYKSSGTDNMADSVWVNLLGLCRNGQGLFKARPK